MSTHNPRMRHIDGNPFEFGPCDLCRASRETLGRRCEDCRRAFNEGLEQAARECNRAQRDDMAKRIRALKVQP